MAMAGVIEFLKQRYRAGAPTWYASLSHAGSGR